MERCNSITSEVRQTGRVKWFNVKHGYGFITPINSDLNDIFVHHTSLSVRADQYKYLTEGEYVNFNLEEVESSEHKYHAVDVTGISRGFLLCETKNASIEESKKRKYESRSQNSRSQSEPPPQLSRTSSYVEPPTPRRTQRRSDDDFEYPRQKRTNRT